MARVPYPNPETLPSRAREFLEKLPRLNIFRMLAHADHALEPFVKLGNAFLGRGALDSITRELVILRVGYLSDARYEVFQHERIARGAGMSDALIAAVRKGPDADGLSPVQRDVLRYVDDLVRNVRASDATFEPLRAQFDLKQLQEVTLLTGYYMMVCRFLNTFDVDLESSGKERA